MVVRVPVIVVSPVTERSFSRVVTPVTDNVPELAVLVSCVNPEAYRLVVVALVLVAFVNVRLVPDTSPVPNVTAWLLAVFIDRVPPASILDVLGNSSELDERVEVAVPPIYIVSNTESLVVEAVDSEARPVTLSVSASVVAPVTSKVEPKVAASLAVSVVSVVEPVALNVPVTSVRPVTDRLPEKVEVAVVDVATK